MAKGKGKKIKPKRETKKEKFNYNIWDFCAGIITATDEILDEVWEILRDGCEGLWNVSAAFVVGFDKVADLISWIFWKTFVLFARRFHAARINLLRYRKEILKHFGIAVAAILCLVGIFASTTDYEYSYNGRALGVVKEQREVLEILDLISTELSHEYGSNITIDP